MELSFKQRLFYFFPVLFCFCLPFGTVWLSPLILFWVFVSFLNFNKKKFIQGIKQPLFIFFYSFFLLTLISALLSENKTEAMFSIEVKLSFFLFPYLLLCFHWPLSILKRCVVSYVSGCFFACAYLLIRAMVHVVHGQPDYLYYSLFSNFIHAAYFAMYLILATIFVILFYDKWFRSQKTVLYSAYFFVAIFVLSIFLCSSKLGIISFFICIPLVLIHKWKKYLDKKRILIAFAILVLMVTLLVKLFPGAFSRLNSLRTVSLSHIDKSSSESTTVRILIWEQAGYLIKENFLIGTGVGDANDALYKSYEANGLTGAFTHRFNAHNQFLQTFIGMGILGFLLLLSLTLWQMIHGLRRRSILLSVFSFLITLNFIVESMLQTAAGVLFFAFFLCLLSIIREQELLFYHDQNS